MNDNFQKNWSLGTIERFLSLVEKFPAIWNESDVHFKQESVKAKHFRTVSKLMKIPNFNESTARETFQSIRDAVIKRLNNNRCLEEEQQAEELQKSFYPSAKYLVDMYTTKFEEQNATPSSPDQLKPLTNYWTEDDSRMLLKIVERYPVIWKPKEFEKSDRKIARYEALLQVSKEMGMGNYGPDLMLKKFTNLRDHINFKIRTGRTKQFSTGYYPDARYLIDYFISLYPQYSLEPSIQNKAAVQWNLQHSINLLNQISKYPCIWQEDHPQFHNAEVRAEVLQTVCYKLNFIGYDTTELLKRFEIIRARVHQKCCQLQECDDHEQAAGYFPAADFLIKEYFRMESVNNERLTSVEDYTHDAAECSERKSEMSKQLPPITHSTCRICLKASDGTFKSIFEVDKSYGLWLDEVFQQTTNYTVITDQPFYPASLCGACEQELLQSYLFKAKCEETETFLEKLYNCKSQEEANELYTSRGERKEIHNNTVQETRVDDSFELIERKVDVMENVMESKANFMVQLEHEKDYNVDIDKEVINSVDSTIFIDEASMEEVDDETLEKQITEQMKLLEQKDGSHFDANEDTDDIDDTTLELQITEQLEKLESSSNFAEYRVPDEKFPCEFCGKFMTWPTLKSHIEHMHSDNPPILQCDLCSEFLKGKNALRCHKNAKHPTVKRLFKCRYCDFIARTFATRRYHERSKHEEGLKFPCPICGTPFLTSKRLELHRLSHAKGRNFQCSGCGKQFKNEKHRDAHYLEFHTGILQKCQYCDQEFQTKRARRVHINRNHCDELAKAMREREEMDVLYIL